MSRASIVGMLVAAEVLVIGTAIYVVGHSHSTFAAGMHGSSFSAASFAPVSAGSAPHVVIDDAVSRVGVAPSSDDLVHVRDLTEIHGAIFSNASYPRLTVTRTPDGVRIARLHTNGFSLDIFGLSTQAIRVEVPRNARVEIARCAGADVSGIAGDVSVRSLDGHVTLTDLQGSADARSDDGSLDATNVRGDRLVLDALDGHVALENVAVGSLLASTRDGDIKTSALSVTGNATLSSDDGTIRLALAPNANLTIDATTRDGSISVDGNSIDGDDSTQRTIRLGPGAGQMKLETADGSIHIDTHGEYQQ
jgi:hypothetical protein